jgi:hypothetical protein
MNGGNLVAMAGTGLAKVVNLIAVAVVESGVLILRSRSHGASL